MSIYKIIYMYYLNKLYNIVDKSYNFIKHRKIRQFRFEHINIPLKKKYTEYNRIQSKCKIHTLSNFKIL